MMYWLTPTFHDAGLLIANILFQSSRFIAICLEILSYSLNQLNLGSIQGQVSKNTELAICGYGLQCLELKSFSVFLGFDFRICSCYQKNGLQTFFMNRCLYLRTYIRFQSDGSFTRRLLLPQSLLQLMDSELAFILQRILKIKVNQPVECGFALLQFIPLIQFRLWIFHFYFYVVD